MQHITQNPFYFGLYPPIQVPGKRNWVGVTGEAFSGPLCVLRLRLLLSLCASLVVVCCRVSLGALSSFTCVAVVFGVAIVLIGRAILDAGRLPVERVLLAYLKSSPSSQLAVRLLRALREFLHVPTLAEFATTLLLLTHLSIQGAAMERFWFTILVREHPSCSGSFSLHCCYFLPQVALMHGG